MIKPNPMIYTILSFTVLYKVKSSDYIQHYGKQFKVYMIRLSEKITPISPRRHSMTSQRNSTPFRYV